MGFNRRQMKIINVPKTRNTTNSDELLQTMAALKPGQAIVLETALELMQAQRLRQKNQLSDSKTSILIYGDSVLFFKQIYLHRCELCKKEVKGVSWPTGWIGSGNGSQFSDITDTHGMLCEKCKNK